MSNWFRTAAGRVVLDDDRLRIERRPTGAFGTFRDALVAGDVPLHRRALTALVLLAALGALGEALLSVPLPVAVAVAVLPGTVVARVALRTTRNGVETVTVPLDDVVGVEVESGSLSRPRIVLKYRDEGGVKHRVLRLPPRLYGTGALAKAEALFAGEGLWARAVGESY